MSETYRGRDNIEKFFRESHVGLVRSLGVHSDLALAGKIHLLFLAGILRNRLLQASRVIKQETGNKRNFTVPGIIDQLEIYVHTICSGSIPSSRSYDCQAENKFRRPWLH